MYKNLEYVNVPKIALEEYKNKMTLLLNFVDNDMKLLNQKHQLIGENFENLMFENHKNHGHFMSTVFELNNSELIINTLPWVLDSYMAKGFKKDYFIYELESWMNAIDKIIGNELSKEIINNYRFMKAFVEKHKMNDIHIFLDKYPYGENDQSIKEDFVVALLEGNYKEAIKITERCVKSQSDLNNYYEKIVKYAMYDIGSMWQKGKIDVAQEHLSTSIVMRIMSYFYTIYTIENYDKGKAIITAAANEMHEVGARIIADTLELDGWDILYIGSNTPIDDLIKYIKIEEPVFIGISITMTYNLDTAKELINRIRNDIQITNLKIIIGGFALKYCNNDIDLGQDELIIDTDELLSVTRKWWHDEITI